MARLASVWCQKGLGPEQRGTVLGQGRRPWQGRPTSVSYHPTNTVLGFNRNPPYRPSQSVLPLRTTHASDQVPPTLCYTREISILHLYGQSFLTEFASLVVVRLRVQLLLFSRDAAKVAHNTILRAIFFDVCKVFQSGIMPVSTVSDEPRGALECSKFHCPKVDTQ